LLEVSAAHARRSNAAGGFGAAYPDLEVIVNDSAEAGAVGLVVGAMVSGDLEWGHGVIFAPMRSHFVVHHYRDHRNEFKQLNFANDTVMEQQLEDVKKELLTKTAEEYRDSAVARARLKNGLSQLANQARNLARQDASELVQRFGELGRRKFNLAA